MFTLKIVTMVTRLAAWAHAYRKTGVRSVAVGWEGRLSDCGLTLIKLKGKRTVDASGVRKMVLKVVKICGHIFQVSK